MSPNNSKLRSRKGKSRWLWVIAVVGLVLLVWFGVNGANPLALVQTLSPEIASTTPTAEIEITATPLIASIDVDPPTASGPIPADSPIVLIGTVIDGTGADPLIDGVVVIEGDEITAVGPREDVDFPAGAYVIEMQGVTILPGFINAHVHAAYTSYLLKQWAQEGVTMVRDLGARHPFNKFSVRDENNLDPELATVISAGPLVTVPGGYPIAGNHFSSLTISDVDEARSKITELISDGVDVIKIVIQEDAGFPTLPMESAKAIVETAHQAGIPVSAHITTINDLKFALEADVDDAAHMVAFQRVPGYLLEQMVEAGMIWVPTIEALGGRDGGNLERFVDLGGTVALGNDGGMLPGIQVGMPIREIGLMYDAGMSPMEIIVASTSNAAVVCHREDTHGTLEAGKTADILVVYGDPLVDLAVLTEVRMVIHNGVVIRNGAD